MYDEDIDIDAIRRRVNQRFWRWGSVGVHFVIWMIGTGLIASVTGENDPVIGSMVAVVWFGILLLHAMLILMLGMRATAIQRAIDHERRLLHGDKPKRSERLILTDDGEVVELEAANWEEDKHQSYPGAS
jgi:hypothetical protein